MDELKDQINEIRRVSKTLNIIEGSWHAFVVVFCSWEIITLDYPGERILNGFFIFLSVLNSYLLYKNGRLPPLPEESRVAYIKYFTLHCEREEWLNKFLSYTYVLPFGYAFTISMILGVNALSPIWFWTYLILGFLIIISGLFCGQYYSKYFFAKKEWLYRYQDKLD